jgi:SPP1 gp7 family putative phage head morphogenesis protein
MAWEDILGLPPTLSVLTRLIEAFTAQRKRRALSPIERKIELAMQTAFRKQGQAFLAALNHRAGVLAGRLQEAPGDVLPPNWEAIFDTVAAQQSLFAAATEGAIEAALVAGAQRTMADFSIEGSFDLTNRRAAVFLDTHGAEAVTRINLETKRGLRTLISTGLREGQSYDEIARNIRARFGGFSTPQPQQHIRSRAHLVAVTETGNAYEVGNRAVADDLVDAGLVMEKSWLTVGDNRVSDDCAANEGADWIPLDDTFPGGVDQPLQHPSCRCTMLLRRQPASARVAA